MHVHVNVNMNVNRYRGHLNMIVLVNLYVIVNMFDWNDNL